MTACPFCAEQIQDAAIICRCCGRDLPTGIAPASAPAAPHPATPGDRRNPILAVGICVALIGAAAVIALDTPARSGTSTAAPSSGPRGRAGPPPAVLPPLSWSGTGMKATEVFDVARSEWRIRWTARAPARGSGLLVIYVYTSSRDLVTVIQSGMEGGSDVSSVHASPGTFYLEMSSAGAEWTVTVER